MEIFKDLEENGIEIELENGTKRVFFALALIVGDNLALNTLLGFAASFSAKFFCRMCKMPIEQTRLALNPTLLRSKKNFDSDLKIKSFEKTGIKFDSVLNTLNHFHSTLNISVDIMHDLFEGVCNYVICLVLLRLIDDPSINFDLDDLNERKDFFDYGCILISNISVKKITMDNLRQKIKMSSSEMMTFSLLLPLMIGDLIPENNPYWKMLLTLNDLIENCLKSSYDEESLSNLNDIIQRHNKMFIELFDEHLKPKFHIMLHYIDVIRKCGPLRHIWSFVFESKNREEKSRCNCLHPKKKISLNRYHIKHK